MRKSSLFMINKDLMMEKEGSEDAFYGEKISSLDLKTTLKNRLDWE